MKRLVFTCIVTGIDDIGDDPQQFVNMALQCGDRHQDFFMYPWGEIKVEETE